MEIKNKISIKDLTVTQSNPLVEATYPRTIHRRDGTEVDIDMKVSTRAHKVSRLIISLINPKDEDLRFYKIDISTLKTYLGYKPNFPNGKFYQDLRDIAMRLNQQPIEIRPEPKRLITAFFISSYELNYKTGEAIFEISGQLKPFLLQLKNNFTSVHLSNIPKLSSGYSIRLYELLYQFKTIGKRSFDDIDRLQQMIGSSYDKYSHFKARVLEPVKKDITKNTNITFEYEEVKTGKKITKLIFYVKENTPVAELVDEQMSFSFSPTENTEGGDKKDDGSFLNALKNVGIHSDKAQEYLKLGFNIIKNEEKRVGAIKRCVDIETYYAEKLTLLKTTKPDVENPVGYLIKALQEDWVSSKASKEVENQRQLNEQREKHNQAKKLEKQIELAQKQYNAMLKPIFEKLASNPALFMEAYETVLATYLPETMFYKMIKGHSTPQLAYKNSTALYSLINNYFVQNFAFEFGEATSILENIGKMKEGLSLIK
jgi:plasmid replication initiation protein